MSIDLDDEILQDFLVEAGEIVELLGEQLVELEQSPSNYDLLNAIFRGFHTIKGGAGFLSIEPLVNICHKAEDVFNVLRQGERQVSQNLMDVILQVLDVVHEMFGQVRNGEYPEPANAELLDRLQFFAVPGDEEPLSDSVSSTASKYSESEAGVVCAAMPAPHDLANAVEKEFEAMLEEDPDLQGLSGSSPNDDITEEEFEELLDALHGKVNKTESGKASTMPASNSDDITEEEFDAYLDQMHGKGKFNAELIKPENLMPSDSIQDGASDEITEDEFEQVLDGLHGKGKFTVIKSDLTESSISAPVSPKPSISHKETVQTKVAPKEKIQEAAKEKVEHPVKPATTAVESLSPEASGDEANKKSSKAAPAASAQAENTVRVDTQILDDIMNMVGELVLVRNRFQTLKVSAEISEEMSKAVANLDLVTADLQLAVMKTRMQPIKKVFGRFPRVVRDLARSLNKEIRLDLIGEETDLDKNLVEALADPLVHLVRNAVDHGIENPDERQAAGKPREGIVILKASQEGDHIQLSIKDDGKGMNPEQLRRKVVEKGLMDEDSAARLDKKECFNLIFLPGFSTKNEISDVSGRGVGMDVVKTRINQMNGLVEVDSVEGIGSTITIRVPLTLAIMPTLMVKLGTQAFALPLASVLEILDLDLRSTNTVDGQLVIMVRQKALPIFYLSDWLINDPYYVTNKKRMGHVVVVNAGGRQVGFVVDQLVGQEEVVIKALGAKLHGLDGLSGATITGDGKIALILDVPGLMKKYAN